MTSTLTVQEVTQRALNQEQLNHTREYLGRLCQWAAYGHNPDLCGLLNSLLARLANCTAQLTSVEVPSREARYIVVDPELGVCPVKHCPASYQEVMEWIKDDAENVGEPFDDIRVFEVTGKELKIEQEPAKFQLVAVS